MMPSRGIICTPINSIIGFQEPWDGISYIYIRVQKVMESRACVLLKTF